MPGSRGGKVPNSKQSSEHVSWLLEETNPEEDGHWGLGAVSIGYAPGTIRVVLLLNQETSA